MTLNPSRWTLRTKLVASIVALFIAVTALTGAATVLSTRNSLMRQVDQQLVDIRKNMSEPHDADNTASAPPPSGESHHPVAGLGGGMMRLTVTQTKTVENYVPTANGSVTKLTTTQISAVKTVEVGPEPTTVNLGGNLGNYRVIAFKRSDGDLVFTGFPMAGVDESLGHLTRNIIALSMLGLLFVGGGSFWLVRRNLRPLRRVATTAERVSELPLAQGLVRTDERVPSIDTDPHTEVGIVGLALNNLLDHVDSALDARYKSEMQVRQFVADASHELRTPLASIRGYAEISKRETEPVPAGITHALGRIESEAGRMSTLVEDLLLLARLDAGRELERKPVDITQVVIETLSDLHAAGPDHVWRLNLPDNPEAFPEVIGDEARLRQVIINLLANARKHTPAGTVVTAGLRHDERNVMIDITDNGPGIPSGFIPHLFERFTRGDAARTRTEGSTGLGLSIVDAVVAAHHGTVEVESKPGATCFTVTLPIAWMPPLKPQTSPAANNNH